jgi:hypothetical protein
LKWAQTKAYAGRRLAMRLPLTRFSEGRRLRPHPPVSAGLVALSLVGIAACGALTWFVYLLIAWSGCHGGEYVIFNVKTGGAASSNSLRVTALVGGCLLLVVALIGFRFRPRLRYLFVSFEALYIVALIVLWNLSPLFWGARRCTE